ncbi:MAG: hypothetical protein HYU66_03340 [Armatimonadetes bacterium]|nr:hypothetical protein [Armatimonadota bacterium]
MRHGLLVALLLPALAAAAELRVERDKILANGRPVALRGLVYPFQARRGGVAFDPADVLGEARADGLNAIFADVTDGPGAEDAARLVAEADKAAEPCFTIRKSAAPFAMAAAPALFEQALSYGAWSAGLAARSRAMSGPLVARVEVAPPDGFVSRHLLRSAAPQPDLYRDTRQRPAVSARFAGEYLLVPEPAQIRLATYAALAAGARGVFFDHAGHLCDGPDPYNGVDRRLTMRQLCAEMAAMERFMAGGQALPPPRAVAGVATGLLALGRERLVLAYRDRPLDSRSVGGAGAGPFTLDVPVENAAGLRVYALAPDGLRPLPADLRSGALRISVEWLDLTGAWLITPEPVTELAQALDTALPETAARASRPERRRAGLPPRGVHHAGRGGASAGLRLPPHRAGRGGGGRPARAAGRGGGVRVGAGGRRAGGRRPALLRHAPGPGEPSGGAARRTLRLAERRTRACRLRAACRRGVA